MTDVTSLESKLEQQLNVGGSGKAAEANKPSKSKKESDKFLLKTAKVNLISLQNIFIISTEL